MQTRLYVGLDLHSTSTYIGVLDDKERRYFEGRFPSKLEVILAMIEPWRESDAHVVVESLHYYNVHC